MAGRLPTKPGQQLVPAHRRGLTTRNVDPYTGRPLFPGELPPSTAVPIDPMSAGFGYPVPTIPAGGIADLPERKLLEPYRGEFPPDTELLRTQHGTPTVFEAEGEEYPEGRLRGPLSELERERPGGAAKGEGIYSGEEFKVGEQYFEDYGAEFGTAALYEMGIPKSLVEETFLDIDAPMSEQPEGIEERMMNLLRGINPEAVNQLPDDPTGEEVFRMAEKELFTGWLMADKQLRSGKKPRLELARRLQAQGIPGLRFLDQYSRESYREENPESGYELSLWGDVYDLDEGAGNSWEVPYRSVLYDIVEEISIIDHYHQSAIRPSPLERTSSGTDFTASAKEHVVKRVMKQAEFDYAVNDISGADVKAEILRSLLDDIGALEIRDKPQTRNHVVWDQRLLDQISRSTLTRKKAAGGFIDKPLYERTL